MEQQLQLQPMQAQYAALLCTCEMSGINHHV